MGSMIGTTALLAHQGGWDEILLVGVPILLIVGLLAIAKRRVDAQAAGHQAGHGPHDDARPGPQHRGDPERPA